MAKEKKNEAKTREQVLLGTQTGSKHGKCKKEAALIFEADPCALLSLSNLFTDENIRIWRLMICGSWHHGTL